MKHFFFLLFLSTSFTAYSQTQEEFLKDFMKNRREMMKKMDKLIEKAMNGNDSSFFQGIGSMGASAKVEQIREDDGSISVFITPPNKETELDIKTENGFITIKSERKVEEKSDNNGFQSSSFSSSSSSQSIQIPRGYKAGAIEAKDGKLFIKLTTSDKSLKMKDVTPKKVSDSRRLPIEKPEGEESL